MEIKEIGYSDKLMFYRGAGYSTTLQCRIRFDLSRPVNREALKIAGKKAAEAFPEFSYRPVIKDNMIFKTYNLDREVAVYDDNQPHYYGSDDTNGYLFYIMIAGEKSFALSFAHAVSDFKGAWPWIKTLLYHYSKLEGLDVPADDDIKLAPSDSGIKNPYESLADENAVPSVKLNLDNVFTMSNELEDIYPDESDEIHNFEVVLDLQQFIAKTKELHVSFAPLLVTCSALAVNDTYNAGDKTISVKITIDLRPVFGIETSENFSDSLTLPVSSELRQKNISEICTELLTLMREELKPQNYGQLIARKVNTVKGYESGSKSIEELEHENSYKDSSKTPSSCKMAYLGRLTLPDEYDELFTGIVLEPYASDGIFSLYAGTSKTELTYRISQRFDSDRLAKNVARRFSELGIAAQVYDRGILRSDKLLNERLTHI